MPEASLSKCRSFNNSGLARHMIKQTKTRPARLNKDVHLPRCLDSRCWSYPKAVLSWMCNFFGMLFMVHVLCWPKYCKEGHCQFLDFPEPCYVAWQITIASGRILQAAACRMSGGRWDDCPLLSKAICPLKPSICICRVPKSQTSFFTTPVACADAAQTSRLSSI